MSVDSRAICPYRPIAARGFSYGDAAVGMTDEPAVAVRDLQPVARYC